MNNPLHEFENLFLQLKKDGSAEDDRLRAFLKLFQDLVFSLCEHSSLHFHTLFARVSYITTRYHLSRSWTYAFQIARRELKQRQLADTELVPLLNACIEYLLSIYRHEVSGSIMPVVVPKLPNLPPPSTTGRFKKKFARVIAVEWNREQKQFTAIDEDIPGSLCYVHYCVEGINDIFCETLELAVQEIGLPLTLGLSNVETTEEHQYIPSYIVILPDLLLDVTNIAQAIPSGAEPEAVNLVDLFLPSESTTAILTGHVANYFLDELIRDPELTYDDLFTRSFKYFPIEFVHLQDDNVREMYKVMRNHFENILAVILKKFPALGIDRAKCVIEPSYFSPEFGIKGRLDLYYCHEQEHTASIVELKSGRPFKPNSYGLSNANYHQTLLYELLIKSVHGQSHHRANFILYSCMDQDPLRYAVSVESLQKEAIQKRNELVLLQHRLLQSDQEDSVGIFEKITERNYPDLKGYVRKNLQEWEKAYSGLSPGERSYFKSYAAFITREHMNARIGSDSVDGYAGLAGLWLEKTEVKEEKYQLLRGIRLQNIMTTDNQTMLCFEKTDLTNPLANFRAGDIAILYPYLPDENTDPTKYQLYRANVISIDRDTIVIKLRNNQVHTSQLNEYHLWNIEHDLLDSSFKSLYQSLWSFMTADIATRQLLFGLRKPTAASIVIHPRPEGLTDNQHRIYQEALNASQLYLLWGPPGTGKTSMMLKSWLWYYYYHTDARIVLLAYTNKAVDEICNTLHELGPDVSEHYIRIGSRAGTADAYRCRLLDSLIEPMSRRREVKALVEGARIYVATVASFQGKNEICRLIDFDVAIIDEASQILEPVMTGMLTHFKKAILIGDHMQLPAITTQSRKWTMAPSSAAWAKRIGLTDLSMSYFERIYRLYSDKGWHEMIGILNEQGRMHEDIQQFANEYVYEGKLSCLAGPEQKQSLASVTSDPDSFLFANRMIFIPCSAGVHESLCKTNEMEADLAVELIGLWQDKIRELGLEWKIGVITPFRAQIAAILHKAHLRNFNMLDVMVDTVERYQGGARDIIIMSAAVNNTVTLERIVSRNPEGIDRKLNVAVTRARQQFILLGNPEILQKEYSYNALINLCRKTAPAELEMLSLIK